MPQPVLTLLTNGFLGNIIAGLISEVIYDFSKKQLFERWLDKRIIPDLQKALRQAFREAVGDILRSYEHSGQLGRLPIQERELVLARCELLRRDKEIAKIFPPVDDPRAVLTEKDIARIFTTDHEEASSQLVARLEELGLLEGLPSDFRRLLENQLLDGITFYFVERGIKRNEKVKDAVFFQQLIALRREEQAARRDLERILANLETLDARQRWQQEVLTKLESIEALVKRTIHYVAEQGIGFDFVSVNERLEAHKDTPPALSFYALEELPEGVKPPPAFYDGVRPGWPDIVNNLDIPRSVEPDPLTWALACAAEFPFPGRVPLGLILGRGGDGKTTLLMRLGAKLVELGYAVLWHKEDRSDLNADQVLALLAEMRRDTPAEPGTTLFVLVDVLTRFEAEMIRGFLRRLQEERANVVVLATTWRSLWEAFDLSLDDLAQVQTFSLQTLRDEEIDALLDKLEEHGALGQLAGRSRAAQREIFRRKADRQLLVALLEAKRNAELEAIAERELKAIAQRYGEEVKDAALYVSALHRWDLAMPRGFLCRLLGMDNWGLEREVLAKTRTFLMSALEGDRQITTRHTLVAEILFWREGEKIAQLLWEKIIGAAEAEDQALLGRALHQARLRARRGGEDGAREARLGHKLIGLLTARFPNNPFFCQIGALLEKEAGNHEEARRLFEKGVEADPRHAPVWQAWALMEKELGEYEEARRLFEKGVEANPKSAPTWQAWALMEKELGNYEEARRLFEKAAEVDPNDPFTWQAWALMEKELGNYEEARRLFEKGVEADPKSAPTWQAWALMEKELGNYEEARRLFEKAAEVDPESALTWQAWGSLEHDAGNFVEARRLLRIARDLDATSSITWQTLGMVEGKLGNPEAARRAFRKALECEPNSPIVLQAWGVMESKAGNYEQAKKLLQKSLEFGPEDPMTWHSLGVLCSELGDIEGSRYYFKEADRRNPGNPVILLAWGLAESKHGDIDEAERLLELATLADPQDQIAWSAWGTVKRRRKQWAEAERLYRKALEIVPESPKAARTYSELGQLLLGARGREQEAEIYLLKAISMNDRDQWAHTALGKLYSRQRARWPDAEHHFKRALEIEPENDYVWASLGRLLAPQQGRAAEAEACFLEALRLNEASARTHSLYATFLGYEGRCDEALEHFRRSFELEPDHPKTMEAYRKIRELCDHDEWDIQ